jgi:hypothetical protein
MKPNSQLLFGPLAVWISIALNLVSLDRHSALWARVKPVYGLMQRSLFAAWFGWCTGIGVMLWQHRRASP